MTKAIAIILFIDLAILAVYLYTSWRVLDHLIKEFETEKGTLIARHTKAVEDAENMRDHLKKTSTVVLGRIDNKLARAEDGLLRANVFSEARVNAEAAALRDASSQYAALVVEMQKIIHEHKVKNNQ
jgi:hypothetical protein